VITHEFTDMEDELSEFNLERLELYKIRVREWLEEGRRSASALFQYGHTELRVIVDSEWELAITCDNCGLWGNMTRKIRYAKGSYQSVTGTLFRVVECLPNAQSIHFGGGR
jgi:hypothetical protein